MKLSSMCIGIAMVVASVTAGNAQALGNNSDARASAYNKGPVAVSPQGAGGAGQGSAQLFAVVNADGTLARDKGAASATRSSVGNYQVRFARNVRFCGYTATVGLGGASGVSAPGMVTVAGEALSVLGVYIQTFDHAGVLADRGFHLYVDC